MQKPPAKTAGKTQSTILLRSTKWSLMPKRRVKTEEKKLVKENVKRKENKG